MNAYAGHGGVPAQNIKHLLDKCFSPKILGHIEIV